MVSNPTQLENCKRMKISGLMLALLMVLTPVLTLGTASATGVNSGGDTDCEVLWNDQGFAVTSGLNANLQSSGNHLILLTPRVLDVGVNCVNSAGDDVTLELEYNTQTVTDVSTSALAVQTVQAVAGQGTMHTLTFEWDDGTHSGSAIIRVIPMLLNTTDTTPRISMWYGKVNQHNDNGVWTTDSDGVSGAGSYAQWGSEGYGDRKLEYCQKFWPNTTSIQLRDFREEITFWTLCEHQGRVRVCTEQQHGQQLDRLD